jgi:hypothetical protein
LLLDAHLITLGIQLLLFLNLAILRQSYLLLSDQLLLLLLRQTLPRSLSLRFLLHQLPTYQLPLQ